MSVKIVKRDSPSESERVQKDLMKLDAMVTVDLKTGGITNATKTFAAELPDRYPTASPLNRAMLHKAKQIVHSQLNSDDVDNIQRMGTAIRETGLLDPCQMAERDRIRYERRKMVEDSTRLPAQKKQSRTTSKN